MEENAQDDVVIDFCLKDDVVGSLFVTALVDEVEDQYFLN